MNPRKMTGKITIVTGGAQGIGKTAAERFGVEGAKVVLWDIHEEKACESVSLLRAKGIEADFRKVDTTQYEEVDIAARKVFEAYGRIDILINSAGIIRGAGLKGMTREQWQEVIDINLTGVSNCTKAVAPYMVRNNFGRIVNSTSLANLYGNFDQTSYTATKSGIVSITKVWARELSKYGITVNAVSPGFMETDTMQDIPENIIQSIKDRVPVGRLGKPEDIAHAYMFLASEEASYITGAILNVDGGYVA